MGGISYTYSPTEFFGLELGVGQGLSGLQISVMPTLSAGVQRHRFVAGVGVSVGIQSLLGAGMFVEPLGEKTVEKSVVPFLNAEVGYEYRHPNGFTFHVATGYTALLDGSVRGGGWWQPGKLMTPTGSPQMRIGFGYRF